MLFYNVEKYTKDVYFGKLKRRVWSLLIPYIIWNAISLFELSVKQLPMLSKIFPNAYKQHIDLAFIFECFWCQPGGSCPMYYPFWYIRNLMVMVLLSPIFYWMLKRVKGFWILLLLGLVFAHVSMPIGFSFSSMFYFSLGLYWAMYWRDTIPNIRILGLFAILWLPLAYMDTITRVQYWHTASEICGIGAILFIGILAVHKFQLRTSETLTQSVFFIYAIHATLLGYIYKLTFLALHPSGEVVCLILNIVIAIITTLCSFGAYKLMDRYLPRVCRVLTGGRR